MAHKQSVALSNLKNCSRGRQARIPAIVALLSVAVTITGCAMDLNLRVGPRPRNLQAIEQRLQVGESTTDDVFAVLGPPRGRGLAVLPIDPIERVTWSYIYLESSIQTGPETKGDMRSLILFVFFDQDRYAGYMWFSSLPK